MLAEVVTGVLVDVIYAAGRRVGSEVAASGGRRYRDEVELARWFDTYRLSDPAVALPELPAGVTDELLAEVLQSDEFQSVLHELLAVRLTDAPEVDASRVRMALSLTLSSALMGVDVSVLSEALYGYYDGRICELVGRLQGRHPGLLEKIRAEAFAARTIAVLHAIERHVAALAGQADPQADAEFVTRYRRHVRDYHGKLEPPDFDRRRRVAIADLYVVPGIVQVVESKQAQPPRVIDLWILSQELDRTVLLGDPGGGKTSAAHVLMHLHGQTDGRLVPFMVTLREFAASDPPTRSVVGHIENRMETFYQCSPPAGLVERLLLSGGALVVFDGLDELVDTARRADVTAIIEQFSAEYPLAQILVTSRLVGYDEARLDDRQFVCYRLGGFDEARTTSYVIKWFSQEPGVEPADAVRWADAFMAESAEVADLRSNPLMLALMCILYRGEGSIPRNRPEVYESCSNLLFRKWDARRHIDHELRARHLIEPALRHLAFWMFTQGEAQAAVTERALVDETAQVFHSRGFESRTEAEGAAAEFVRFCRGRAWVFSDAGTTADGERLYAFAHRTFLEYFAAAYLATTCDTPEKLAQSIGPHVARQEWEVVADLATQIKDRTTDRGAERIITALLNDRRHRSIQSRSHTLQFVAHSLRFVDPPPRTVRVLSQNILDHAFSGNPDDNDRCHPLHHLLTGCTRAREIVKDEVAEQARALTNSAEPLCALNGIRLAVWVDDRNILAQNNRVGHWRQELLEFWTEAAGSAVAAYSERIIAAAHHNTMMMYMALLRGLVTADQALTTVQPNLETFFTSQPTFFGIVGPPYLLRHAYDLTHGRKWYWGNDPIADFQAFGRFIIERPWSSPFVTNPHGYTDNWLDELNRADPSQVLPDTAAYLGASLTFAIGAETSEKIPLHWEPENRFGALSDFYPYVRRRYRIEPNEDLPLLPLPRQFRELFNSWANREIDFTRIEG